MNHYLEQEFVSGGCLTLWQMEPRLSCVLLLVKHQKSFGIAAVRIWDLLAVVHTFAALWVTKQALGCWMFPSPLGATNTFFLQGKAIRKFQFCKILNSGKGLCYWGSVWDSIILPSCLYKVAGLVFVAYFLFNCFPKFCSADFEVLILTL